MKVISIWQPFASLIVSRCKFFETRSWPAPKSIIGQQLGIAATKSINPVQRAHCACERFQEFYGGTGLPHWEELPRGALIGSVTVTDVELMTEEFIEDVSLEEQAYGNWEIGNYAWRLTNSVVFATPIPIRGKQGIFDWKGDPDNVGFSQKKSGRNDPGRSHGSQNLRGHLSVVRR